ncbi:MAG: LysE family transporter [Polaromonas sp.]|uniref:LysE/ArgO family amino acid transporter n=1 Tax=Polaromonas sp. TaxID=1869339 RepID=UPI00273739CF|nr:LysE family transporter [Polaromonas sp.]MDP2818150.1 LysE family transporter [Polaromonas sp.]
MTPLLTSSFFAGMVLSLSLIMAIGPQNAHIIRVGLLRRHLWLTVGVCVATDVVLIAIGVAGLAQLGDMSGTVLRVMTAAGALVLFFYGASAMRRFFKTPLHAAPRPDAQPAAGTTRREAIGLALALSWLNPHAWLDTAVLIGTASLAYAQPHNAVFGLGAATGSLLWFVGLGAALGCAGQRFDSPAFWRALDLLVALMMWGTALWLVLGLR